MCHVPTKAQHSRAYKPVPGLLKEMRESAGLTQREIGSRLKKPQSWIYNCESGNRRVDVAEFSAWCDACGVNSLAGFKRFLELKT